MFLFVPPTETSPVFPVRNPIVLFESVGKPLRFRKPQRFGEPITCPTATAKFLTNARFCERGFVNWGNF
jgi:hypothetical protein